MHLRCKLSVAVAAMMSDTRGLVLGLDVGGQLGLELEHGAALLRLALEVGQLVQGLVGVHPLEVASVKNALLNRAHSKLQASFVPPQPHHQITKPTSKIPRFCYLVLRQ